MYSGVREEWEMGWPDADGTSSLRNGGLSEPIDARRPSNIDIDIDREEEEEEIEESNKGRRFSLRSIAKLAGPRVVHNVLQLYTTNCCVTRNHAP
ncbi:hypothetical protein V1478_003872 [Vespula squamosa]|uniref:Uncharacterized protein n=1 Tax=Vespula squamosa TaxID=30214 RepID=A0ABD2BNM1_VESSQ